ncbi:CLIP domain-containing serine protease 2-like isoform X2 [Photinus pyralis]|nr:CLIP domain-containing serine protease 2-like isoform X2 [Photinus pyralis]
MKTITKITPEISDALFKYYCGVEGNAVKVCCADEPIVFPRSIVDENSETSKLERDYKLSLLPSNCGFLNTQNYIVGGSKTSIFDYPWMALLGYKEGDDVKFRCGGTIINENYILTAAHCFQEKPVVVRLGEHNIDTPIDCETMSMDKAYKVCAPPVQDIAIAELIPHPQFSSSLKSNDIALIRLAQPVNTSVETAKPICLPVTNESRNRNYVNDNFIVTGWGLTERKQPSPEKLKVDLPVLSISNCTSTYKLLSVNIDANQQFCVGGQIKKDSCNGDSGGPLQNVVSYQNDIRFTQYGIVSYGPRSCGQGLPSVYTRVDYYTDWILSVIRP